MKIPRGQLRIGAEAAPINMGALLAPEQAAERATEEISHGLADVYGALREKTRDARKLVFQEQLANAAFQFQTELEKKANPAIQANDQAALDSVVANDRPTMITDFADQFSDPEERQKARVFLTEHGNSVSVNLQHRMYEETVKQGLVALNNEFVENQSGVGLTLDSLKEQNAAAIGIAERGRAAGQLSEQGAANTLANRQAINAQQLFKNVVAQAEQQFSVIGQEQNAINFLDAANKEILADINSKNGVIPQTERDNAGNVGVVLNRLRDELRFRQQNYQRTVVSEAFKNAKANAERGIEPDSKFYASLPDYQRKDLDDALNKGLAKKQMHDEFSNAIKGYDVNGNPTSALAIPKGKFQETAEDTIKTDIVDNPQLTPVQKIDSLADAANNVGWTSDYQKTYVTRLIRDGQSDPNKAMLALRYFRQTQKFGTTDNGMNPAQQAFMQKFSELQNVFTGPGVDPLEATAKAYSGALQESPLTGEPTTTSIVKDRLLNVEAQGTKLLSLDKSVFGTRPLRDAFFQKYQQQGIPEADVERALVEQGPVLQQYAKQIYAHDTKGSIAEITNDLKASSLKAVNNVSDEWGFDQNNNFVRGTPLIQAQNPEQRQRILGLMDQTASAISTKMNFPGLSKADLHFEPVGFDANGVPLWGVGVITQAGLIPVKGVFKVNK